MKTVRIRLAVVVSSDGQTAFSDWNHNAAYEALVYGAKHPIAHYWVTAELPVPEDVREIKAEVSNS